MKLSARSLAELRTLVATARSANHEGRLLAALRRDSRRGAAALAVILERRRTQRRRESRRIARLMRRRQALRAAGARFVAGVDEVGMGPLAGPVVAAAVVLPDRIQLLGLDDSKRLTAAARERLDEAIREQAWAYAIAEVSPREVDQRNIYRAGLTAMRRAVEALDPCADHVLVDARTIPEITIPQTPIPGGDALDASIAAASVIAKVHRDATMCALDRQYPGYGFAVHKGYATRAHLAALARLGPSPVHRRSFAPVAQLPLL